ncbi:MAG TPA: ATP-binding protein [Actinophytocola sp.]|uniref:sensor histidine kinase n=1 Tax=Actinophytocola sp. TaxID=1872138 RepID=UPI002DDD6A82|nr:ATP-binding protein [Actinophytocola sp.]HEV2778391.1 ATP-binding protein [Actinophytocola sp.]
MNLLNDPPAETWLIGGSGCDVGMRVIQLSMPLEDEKPLHGTEVPVGVTELLGDTAEHFVIDDEGAGLSLWPFTDVASASVRISRRIDPGEGYLYPVEQLRSGTVRPFLPGEFVTWSHSLEREQDTLNDAVLALAGGTLLVIGLIGATTWITVGRVVRPVEAMRRRVAEITARNLGQRVPVPRARTEIARLAETMNDTLARLDHAVAEQRRFVADASHELRGPIAALRSELEIALAHPERARWPEVVAGALTDTVRLQDLATDLLLLSRLDAAPPELDETVDLVALAREQGALRRLPGQLTLRYDLPDGEVAVSGRHALLGRLVRNLLDNAERHAAGSITLRVAVEDATAVLEVIDDGPGIPPADRERIFDRFTRLDRARTRDTGGAGLGLAIARHIAVIHRGTLAVTGGNGGARFTFAVNIAEHR